MTGEVLYGVLIGLCLLGAFGAGFYVGQLYHLARRP